MLGIGLSVNFDRISKEYFSAARNAGIDYIEISVNQQE